MYNDDYCLKYTINYQTDDYQVYCQYDNTNARNPRESIHIKSS